MASLKKVLAKFKNRIGWDQLHDSTTAVVKINAIHKFISAVASIVGCEYTDEWQFNYRSFATLLICVCMSWMVLYTFFLQFPSIMCTPLIAGFSALAEAFTKFSSFVFNHKSFMSLLNFVLKLYSENVSGIRERILSDAAKKLARHCKLVFVGTMGGLALYAFYPFYDLIVNGNLTLISPVLLPHVDPETVGGYAVLTAWNIFAAFWLVTGIFAFNGLFLFYVDVYDGMVSLIEYDFQLFDSMWENGKSQFINVERALTFRNIMMESMDLVRFNAQLNELFSLWATVQMVGCFFGIVTLLFSYLAINYMSGIGASAFFFTEFLMFCFIGQLLENTNERVVDVLYNSKWYTYEVKYQKDILFALNIFQNAKSIGVLEIYPLNFETGLQVINNIYSLLMFMLNILE